MRDKPTRARGGAFANRLRSRAMKARAVRAETVGVRCRHSRIEPSYRQLSAEVDRAYRRWLVRRGYTAAPSFGFGSFKNMPNS